MPVSINGFEVLRDQFSNRNVVINGSCAVAQRGALTLGAGNDSIAGRGFGDVDRIAGFTTQTASAGTLTRSVAAPVGVTGFAAHFLGVTLSAGGKLHFLYRVESFDAIRFKGDVISISCKVYHDVGSAKTITLFLRDPDVVDIFSATTAISNNGGTSVSNATATVITWENVDLSAANPERGLELEIELDCGAITTKNFYLTELQIEIGEKSTPFEFRLMGSELLSCQRYYCLPQIPGELFGSGYAINARAGWVIPFPVEMQAIPTLTKDISGWVLTDCDSLVFDDATKTGAQMFVEATAVVLTIAITNMVPGDLTAEVEL
jgi:hypothetical protein